jgi:uncharacterized protein YodC (DUF2158 family)
MTEEFKPGDVVMLKSGGPEMTVTGVKDGKVGAVWYRGRDQDYMTCRFDPALLVKTKL